MTKNEFFEKAYETLVEMVNNSTETTHDCNILNAIHKCGKYVNYDDNQQLYLDFRTGKLTKDFIKWLLITQDMSDLFIDINWKAIIFNSTITKTKKNNSLHFTEVATEERVSNL